MKWILVIVSFFFEQVVSKFQQNSSTFLLEKALEKSRSLISLTLLGLVTTLIFSAGIIIAAIDAFSQYDRQGSISFTATFSGGLVLALLAGIGFAIVFAKRNWVTPRLVEEAPKPSIGPMQEAVLGLITEFLNSRKESHEARAHQQNHSANSHASYDNRETAPRDPLS